MRATGLRLGSGRWLSVGRWASRSRRHSVSRRASTQIWQRHSRPSSRTACWSPIPPACTSTPPATRGGPVLTLSHALHAVCWLLGAPRRVTAVAARASALEIDTEDVADIVLQFNPGQTATVHVDYLSRPPRRGIELVGEDGVLRWDFD